MGERLSENSGLRRAAIIMASLGPELVAKVCSQMNEEAVRAIANELAHLDAIKSRERREILKDFADNCDDLERIDGLSMARDILSNTLGTEASHDLLLAHDDGLDPLRYLSEMDPSVIARRLAGELPQTTAVIVSQLAPQKAASVLQEMPEERRHEVLSRMATMRPLAPGTLQALARGLGKMFAPATLEKQSSSQDSLAFLVDVLCNLDRSTEETLLDELEKVDADLVRRIHENLFTFTDVLNLPERGLQTLLRAVDDRQLATALKGLDDSQIQTIKMNLSERAREALEEEIEALGPVRVSEVEEARAAIATHTRQLAESGEITIDYGDVEYIE